MSAGYVLAMKCLAAILLTSHLAAADPTPPGALLSLSKDDHTLAIVDPVTLKVVARVPVGPDPHEVISDGKTAYVSNAYAKDAPSGKAHELDVIDLVAQKALPKIDTGALLGPHGLAWAGGKLWFTAEGAKAIARFDPVAKAVDAIIGTGQDRTHMLRVTADGAHVYATNVDAGTISILDDAVVSPPGNTPPPPHHEWLQTVIPGAKGNEGFAVSPDGKWLWTAAAANGELIVVDIAAKKVDARIDAKLLGANRVAFTRDGKRVLITSQKSGELAVFDAVARKKLKGIAIGHGAAGVVVDDKRAFVACSPDNYLAVIDLEKLEMIGKVDTGKKPDGLAWAARQ